MSNNKNSQKKLITPRRVLSVLTLALVIFVVYKAHDQIFEAVNYLATANIWVVLLIIPEQLFMYYCLGQMFFSYLHGKKGFKKVSPWTLTRVSFELNFVNHAIPSGGIAGLGYASWRLKQFGSSVGQTSFAYILRYVITILANQTQVLIALAFLIITGGIVSGAWWIVWLALALSLGITAVMVALVIIVSSRKRINWFVKISEKACNWVVRTFTFGHKTRAFQPGVIEKYFLDIHQNLLSARKHKSILIKPIIWGIIYNFLECATFWIIGISMGHPEILPHVMVGVAIASVVGSVIPLPGGVGGYEGTMIFIMTSLGLDLALVTAVVITTRVLILVGTIVSGYGFYQHAISKLGKKEKDAIMQGQVTDE